MIKIHSRWLRIAALMLILGIPQSSMAQLSKGGYVGAQVGNSTLGYSSSDLSLPTLNQITSRKRAKNGSFAWYLYTGYQFNQNFAFHLGYIDFQSETFLNAYGTNADEKVNSKALEVMGKFVYPLNSVASVYVLGGFDMVRLNFEPNTLAQALGASNSDTRKLRPAYGVGASYEIYPHLSVDASFSQIVKGNTIEGSNFLGIGLTYAVG